MHTTWLLRDMKRALGLDIAGADKELGRIEFDTRTLQKGDVYVALIRDKNGHDFVPQALKAGAGALLVSEDVSHMGVPQDVPVLQVNDTLAALVQLGEARRDWQPMKRVAVTGSVGKTSVKEMLARALGAYAAQKSFNNHIGVPYTLANIPSDASVGVFEIGTNHPGEILPLAEQVQPHVAVVTGIHPVHIGQFESLDDLAVEKLCIARGMAHGGILVTSDTVQKRYGMYIPDDVTVCVCSMDENPQADVKVLSLKTHGTGQAVVADVKGACVSFVIPDPAEHVVLNALYVLAVAHHVGADLRVVCASLEQFEPVKGRGNVQNIAGVTLVDDSYNANPTSMRAGIARLAKMAVRGRRFALLGHMGELGAESPRYHEELLDVLTTLDGVWLCGAGWQSTAERMPKEKLLAYYENPSAIDIPAIAARLKEGDGLLLKGSKVTLYDFAAIEKIAHILEENTLKQELA